MCVSAPVYAYMMKPEDLGSSSIIISSTLSFEEELIKSRAHLTTVARPSEAGISQVLSCLHSKCFDTESSPNLSFCFSQTWLISLTPRQPFLLIPPHQHVSHLGKLGNHFFLYAGSVPCAMFIFCHF